ncbi:MAG: HlyD family efflux transporter periplasmic adaptor subunit [Phycisphaeraceae bacterium]|nr:HlyD family efflux transporter periplasmic adaptor subunit [Phycisphaerae bacterium]MBX3391996.1 HlyD family efflux transporter periplasmic adaptor subunit [Phycisphaeraceae bacterium]HRJ48943.1 HlyD family efflux transporter periplasmic adaptor subunit [Phycisphaerales bacterium]
MSISSQVCVPPKDVGVAAAIRRRAPRFRRLFAAILGVGVLSAGGWVLVGNDRGLREGPNSGPVPADHAVVRRGGFKITTVASGRLEARRQVEIRSGLDTRSNIVELTAEGTAVKKGDLLMRLNTDEISQSIRAEQLAVTTARADSVAADNAYEIQVNENESKLRQSLSKVKLAELALDQWRQGDVEKKKRELALAIEKTARDFDRLKEKVETSRRLWERGFLSKDEYQRDQIALTEARSAAQAAVLDQQIYWDFKHPEEQETRTSALEESRAELERIKMNNQIELTSKDSARVTRRTQLEIREARLAELEKQLEAATILAPVDGLVVYAFSMGLGWRETPLQVGQPVYRNELVMVIPDTSEMLASVSVQESLASRIAPGQRADLRIDAAGGRDFGGVVESLGVLAESEDGRDQTRLYKVKIALDAASAAGVALKPSMRVDATITLGRADDVLVVPLQAVFHDGPLCFVYERRGRDLSRTPVTVGRISSSSAEITAGIGDGARVLVREPRADERPDERWDLAALASLGFTLDEDGRPVSPSGDPPPEGGAAASPPGTGAG